MPDSPWAAAPSAPQAEPAPIAVVSVADPVPPPTVAEAVSSAALPAVEEGRTAITQEPPAVTPVLEEPEPTGEIFLEGPETAPAVDLGEPPAAGADAPPQPMAPLWSASGTVGISLGQDPVASTPAEEPVAGASALAEEEVEVGLLAEAVLYLPADESEEEAAPTIVQIERQRGLLPGSYWDMSNRYVPPAPEVEEGVVSRPLDGTYWDRSERMLAQTAERDEVEDTESQAGGYWDRSTIRR